MIISKFKRLISSILITSVIILATNIAYAGYEGDACYRDGVFLVEWHAGVVITSDLLYDSTSRIVHAPGPGGVISYTTLSNFIGTGNTFQGSKYMSGVSSSTYANIVQMAKRLADYNNIGYSYTRLLPHNSTGTWVYSYNITGARCDGVPEYCYEFYGVKVWAYYTTSNPVQEFWDISKVSENSYHTGAELTPHSQSYMFNASHSNP